MRQLKADLRELDNLDIAGKGKVLTRLRSRKRLSGKEKTALKAAVDLAAFLNPEAGFLKEPFLVADTPQSLSVKMPTRVPVGSTGGTPRHFTLATSFGVEAFAGLGFSGQFGIYGSTSPEFGVYASFGRGGFVNLGVQVGPQVNFIFGPPSDLHGVSWGVACDVGSVISVGGMLLFSDIRVPPVRFLGFGISFSVGLTKFPVTVSVQLTRTATKPLLITNFFK